MAIKKIVSRVYRYRVCAYFVFLFGLLFYLYYPSFFHPPRSDYWPALYFFYRIDAIGGPLKWACLLAHDPLINATFRPLSFLVAYGEHHVFGTNYSFPQVLNFLFYFLSIILLYKTAMVFSLRRGFVLLFLFLFAFLFSHFDIICWAFHSHIILSFCLLLCAFLMFNSYLRSGDKRLLPFVVVASLAAMLLYEVFFLWPLAIAFLYYLKKISLDNQLSTLPEFKFTAVTVVSIYAVYTGLFLLDRMFKSVRGPAIGLSPLFLINTLGPSIFLVFFNIMYNNIFINLQPHFAHPLYTGDNNLNMSGVIEKVGFSLETLIFSGGVIVLIAFILIALWLYRYKNRKLFAAFLFFAYLLFSELFILFLFKSLVNSSVYNLTQFRFQYIPNAFVLLILACSAQAAMEKRRVLYIVTATILALALVLNMRASRAGVMFLTKELRPVKLIISNISEAFALKKITPERRLFIDRDIVKELPPLCWNNEMGQRCMRGTYEWLFSSVQIGCFSGKEEAAWVLDPVTLQIVPKK